jgi:hypothetical protein
VDSVGETIDFMLSPQRDLTAAKLFLRLALSATSGNGPRVINVDGHLAYARAIAELKQSGELGRRCRCRRSPYLNNVIEQDHRFIKKRIAASLWFRSVEGAWRTIDGYEAMHLIRKGQIRWLPKGDVVGSASSSTTSSASLCKLPRLSEAPRSLGAICNRSDSRLGLRKAVTPPGGPTAERIELPASEKASTFVK